MKPLILIALLSLYCSAVKAQLNQSRSQAMQLMANDDTWTFDKTGRTNDGTEYLSYKTPIEMSSDGNVIITTKLLFFLNDTCLLIKTVRTNNQLNDVIKDMNKRFVSLGNNIWYDNKEKIKYEIILTENYSVFTVQETPLPK